MQRRYTLEQLAHNLDVAIHGDPSVWIEGVSTLQAASSNAIAFLNNPLYKKYLPRTQAAAVILSAEDSKDCPVIAVVSKNPYYTYAKMASYFEDRPCPGQGIHPTAVIGKDCHIDPTARVGAHCVIGDGVHLAKNVALGPGCVIGPGSEIGEGSFLFSNVTIYHGVKIGQRVLLASGVVIGSDGFGIANHQGAWHKVPQLGGVIIEDDVEIGANTTIDRGAIDNTIIRKGVKLDNLIQIGHNVEIGENTVIAACVGVSGSTKIGKNCIVGGQAGFAGHLTIADQVVIVGGTEVSKSIREPGAYASGIGGVVTNAERRKNSARALRLESVFDRIARLEQLVKDLQESKVS